MVRDGLTVKVDTMRLLEQLKINREQHGAAYEKAKQGYIKVTTKQLQEYVEQLANGELLFQRFINSPPEDHTGDYDDAIEMLSWAMEPQIELTQQQFKQYVMDDWGWKDQWMVSNTAYLEA